QQIERAGAKAGVGLVEDQQPGLVEDGAADGQPLLRAPGKLVGTAVRDHFQSNRLQHLGRTRATYALQVAEELQVLGRRERGVQARRMRDVAEVMPQPPPLLKGIEAGDPQPAGGWPQRRCQDTQKRGLAGAVFAEHGHVLARVEHEVQALERDLAAEPMSQPVGNDDAQNFTSSHLWGGPRRSRGEGLVGRRLEQRPKHKRPGQEQEQRRDDQGHRYAGSVTGMRRVANSAITPLSPTLPSSTPRMMTAPPAQIQANSGLTKTLNDAEPSSPVPARTT